MGDLLALNRRQITSDKVIHEGEYYRVFSDGRLEYTADGIVKYAPIFRGHGIDIRKVQSEEDHLVVLDITRQVSIRDVQDTLNLDSERAKYLRELIACNNDDDVRKIEARFRAKQRMMILQDKV